MASLKLAVPDLISNSYFPAAAGVALGFFRDEELDVALELIFPVSKAYEALRDGAVDFVGGSAHSALAAFPEWRGVKLLCAQGQGMYWFLVMRSDLGARRGDLACVKGRSIGAAPWVDIGLRRLLVAAGIDAERDRVTIAPVPGAGGAGVNFGLAAAEALATRQIDGFWANGMGAEVAVKRGVGTVVARCAPRRRAGRVLRLHHGRDCRDRPADRGAPRSGRRRHPRDCPHPTRLPTAPRPRERSRTASVSGERGKLDRRARSPRPALP